MNDQTVQWTLDIHLGKCRGEWQAEAPHLNVTGFGDTPRAALRDLLDKNAGGYEDSEDGGLFFYSRWQDGETLDDVVDSLLPEEKKPAYKAGMEVRVGYDLIGELVEKHTVDTWLLRVISSAGFTGSETVVEEDFIEEVLWNPESGTPEEEKSSLPESKFKVGDKVHCSLCDTTGILAGEEHALFGGVSYWRLEGEPIRVGGYRHLENDLTLVKDEPTPAFKVGDYVECTCGIAGVLGQSALVGSTRRWCLGDEVGFSHPETALEHALCPEEEWYERLTTLGAS